MRVQSITLAAMLAVASSAQAAPIDWNTWATSTSGTITTGSGPVGVTFSGPAGSVSLGYPSYMPAATYADGAIVNNGPVAANNLRTLVGGSNAVNTVTFSQPVVDPVMAIWSLGQPGAIASFVFSNATPVLVSGGPSAEFGGNPITVLGNTVSGSESNGTVRFLGTYTSLSWTNPQFEFYYGFDVGIAGAVPEPSRYGMLVAGLAVAGWMARRRRV